jgi:hypothetical protein
MRHPSFSGQHNPDWILPYNQRRRAANMPQAKENILSTARDFHNWGYIDFKTRPSGAISKQFPADFFFPPHQFLPDWTAVLARPFFFRIAY